MRAGGVDPERIVVEITESTAMADPDRTQKILSELHAWGFTLALDDFGTGYSSLARLKHMPVDVLKIDRAFVHDVHNDLSQASMVRAMIQLAQGLDMIAAGRGRRDPAGVRVPAGQRLPVRAGVPVLPAGPGRGGARLWRRAPRACCPCRPAADP